jgi:hypothetical protein
MKRVAFICVISAMILFAILVHAQDKTFSGSIMDSQCASLGGHEAMYNDEIKDPKACTLACVKEGGAFVLFDPTTPMVYQLDDQKKPEPFAGGKVIVTGTYDSSSMTIHVTKIEAAK